MDKHERINIELIDEKYNNIDIVVKRERYNRKNTKRKNILKYKKKQYKYVYIHIYIYIFKSTKVIIIINKKKKDNNVWNEI